jgi:two-component system sensor histidine kinase/response regulator
MWPLRGVPLGRKLILITMLTSSTTLLLACLAVGTYDWFVARELMVRDLSTLGAVLSQGSSGAVMFGDARAARRVLQTLQEEPHVLVACLYGKNGMLLAKYSRDGTPDEKAIALPKAEGTYFRGGKLVHFRRINVGGENLGALYMESDLTAMDQRRRGYAAIGLLVMLESTLVAYFLAFQLQKPVARPILELVRTAKRISLEKNYALRAAGAGQDELGMLVSSFNEMLEQIQGREEELKRQRADLQREVGARTAMNKQLEAAKEAAEAASHAKGEFLANMSHEIRTPINGVLGMTELVLGTDLTEDQRDCLVMAKSSGESLLGLINDILDFSKVESGHMDLEPIRFNLYNAVGETMRALALRAHQKGLELAYDVSPDVPSDVIGDPGRLRQILVNLIGNAIKFTEHGEVLVEIERRESEEQRVELHFKVADTGIGIPQEKHSLLFKAFSQADSSTTRKYGGSGLGLAISARLVRLMNGEIWLQSTPGQGTTFHFTALFGGVQTPKEHPPAASLAELAGVPVLIVDDNATNQRILRSLTHGWAMRPTVVDSGKAALAVFEAARKTDHPFRIILVDACMPGMDGFQLAEKIHNLSSRGETTVLMLTSAGRPGEAALCRQLGISAYLLKPVLKTDLQTAILTVLGHQKKDPHTDAPLVTRHTLRELPRTMRVLVAEDNPVNQAVVVRVLAKLGHSTVVAANGKEALALVSEQAFDLAFMDVQMPEMDGLSATAAIREMEKSTGQHLPVFAMTAYAMKGDRERCLQAGMDGYIAKPLRFGDIEKTLVEVANASPPSAGRPSSQARAWCKTDALARLDGDEELLQELCRIFLQESPKLLEKLRQAVANSDAEGVLRAAHSLKGEVSYLAAANATRSADHLEDMGQRRDLERAPGMLALLEQELAGLRAAIQEEEEVRQ